MMKKQFLFSMMMLLSVAAVAHDIEVNNVDGITIYYNYCNDAKELMVTFRGDRFDSYDDEYRGIVIIPEEVIVEDSTLRVTAIGENAFRDCDSLTSVTVGNGVTAIGNSAFAYCSGLTSMVIPSGVTSIGNSAFDECLGLTSVIIPNTVTDIGNNAFIVCI